MFKSLFCKHKYFKFDEYWLYDENDLCLPKCVYLNYACKKCGKFKSKIVSKRDIILLKDKILNKKVEQCSTKNG